ADRVHPAPDLRPLPSRLAGGPLPRHPGPARGGTHHALPARHRAEEGDVSGIWFTADLHLGHKLLAGLRGFGEDTAAHDAEIARRWDFLVKPQDQVWVLGDLCIGRGRSHHAALDWIGERPG